MIPGDLVQYRSRIDTDPDLETVPEYRRGWNRTGVVIDVGDWRAGEVFLPGEGVTFMCPQGDIIEACARDLRVL